MSLCSLHMRCGHVCSAVISPLERQGQVNGVQVLTAHSLSSEPSSYLSRASICLLILIIDSHLMGIRGWALAQCKACATAEEKRRRESRAPPNNDPAHVQKKCTRCGIEKPANAFCRNKRSYDGLYSQCRTCVSMKVCAGWNGHAGRALSRLLMACTSCRHIGSYLGRRQPVLQRKVCSLLSLLAALCLLLQRTGPCASKIGWL
jgi:hypothetical protein